MHILLLDQFSQTYSQSYNNQQKDNVYILIAVAVVVVLYFFIRRFINSHQGSVLEKPIGDEPTITVEDNTPILMTMYTLGVGLNKISSGTIQNYNYTIFVTSQLNMLDNNSNNEDSDLDPDTLEGSIDDSVDFDKYDNWQSTGLGRMRYTGLDDTKAPVDFGAIRTPVDQILIKFDLPVKSQVHIAGFSLQDSVFKNLLGNTNINYIMTNVVLEGDFPDYFKIYCQKDKEVEVREVLDPSTMEYLVDFCNQLNWELFENNLYFVQSGTNRTVSDNNAGVLKGSEDFITKILPTLTRMQAYSPSNTPPESNTPNTPSTPNQPSLPTDTSNKVNQSS